MLAASASDRMTKSKLTFAKCGFKQMPLHVCVWVGLLCVGLVEMDMDPSTVS